MACFECQLCPCVFKKLGSLNAHMTKYHPNQDMVSDIFRNMLLTCYTMPKKPCDRRVATMMLEIFYLIHLARFAALWTAMS